MTFHFAPPEVWTFGVDDVDAGLDQVGPGADVLRVALADGEDDDGARDDSVVTASSSTSARRGSALTSDVMSGSSENATTSALRPAIDRARLLARGAVGLLERRALAGGRCPGRPGSASSYASRGVE